MEQNKVPIEKVIDDMSDPNGGMVSSAARDYYCEEYTDEEKQLMDIHDKICHNLSITVVVLILITIALAIFNAYYR